MMTLPETLDLVGMAETADILGTSRQNVANMRKRYYDFPKPVVELRSGPVFWRVHILEWLRYLELKKMPEPAPKPKHKHLEGSLDSILHVMIGDPRENRTPL